MIIRQDRLPELLVGHHIGVRHSGLRHQLLRKLTVEATVCGAPVVHTEWSIDDHCTLRAVGHHACLIFIITTGQPEHHRLCRVIVADHVESRTEPQCLQQRGIGLRGR